MSLLRKQESRCRMRSCLDSRLRGNDMERATPNIFHSAIEFCICLRHRLRPGFRISSFEIRIFC